MNVYDFDGTIYNGDSGVDFIKFVAMKKPFFMLGHMFRFVGTFAKYKMKKIDFKTTKGILFSFVKKIHNLEDITCEFAKKKKNKVKAYYNDQRKDDDIIVSASLDFYLLPLCKEIGLNTVICTKYDVKRGIIIGENCKGNQKVIAFNSAYGEATIIDNSYGDSKNDIPILCRAKNGFVIKNNDVIKYDEKFKF